MHDPLLQFDRWMKEALACPAIGDATAMTLATATAEGIPSARIVLLKEYGPQGFLFYTNLNSRKSHELNENPHAALCFYWMPLERQVRIEGSITRADDAKADAYFASRPRTRQIGAWASQQSESLRDRQELEVRVTEMEKKFQGHEVPRPPHWSGWQVMPTRIEFWHNNPARLHERELYTRAASGQWEYGLLYP